MATEYLISLLEEAYQKLTDAKSVADELERDRVIVTGVADTSGSLVEISSALARIPRT